MIDNHAPIGTIRKVELVAMLKMLLLSNPEYAPAWFLLAVGFDLDRYLTLPQQVIIENGHKQISNPQA